MLAEPLTLASSCMELPGVGQKLAERLAKLHVFTLQDLLFHLPFRYQDRTRLTAIQDLNIEEEAQIEGMIEHAQIHYGRRRSLLITVADTTGLLRLRFFYFNQYQAQQLCQGKKIRCYGMVRTVGQALEMIHPEYQCFDEHETITTAEALTPIYPSTEGITQYKWRQLTDYALDLLKQHQFFSEGLPDSICQSLKLPLLSVAICGVHRPPVDADVSALLRGDHPWQQRLALEELITHQMSLQKSRQTFQQDPAPALKKKTTLVKKFIQSLPFNLTNAQKKVCQEVEADLAQSYPMLRLIQGDVGSGKTVVAAMALLTAVAHGYQAAIMAPTEILAQQHTDNLTAWLAPLGVSVVSLFGKLRAAVRRDKSERITLGLAQVIVGTHALIQDGVVFHKLGLVIIDEQHRFGVGQRMRFKEKGEGDGWVPHQLIMTATPIPRTLAMTAYADLAISIIDELPPGRKPVTTKVVSMQKRPEIIQRIKMACQNGRQAYWVCTLVEESEVLQCQAATNTFEELSRQLPELTCGLVHGRLAPEEKATVMAAFKQGDIQVLVATTVIEVGVDVPNASLMVIEDPDRLGLSQLHQLRGRIGRGTEESHCVLLYRTPLSQTAQQRLQVIRDHQDGFKIAEADLKIRGPGEVLGTKQTGMVSFKIAHLERDQSLVIQAREWGALLLDQHPEILPTLKARWLGQREMYAQVG